jgi:hypothetical protein
MSSPSKLCFRHLINIHLSLELKQQSLPQQLRALGHITWQSKQFSFCLIRFLVMITGHFDCLATTTGMLAAVGPVSIFRGHFL